MCNYKKWIVQPFSAFDLITQMDKHLYQSHYPIYVLSGVFVCVFALSSFKPIADLLSLPGGTNMMISDNVKCHVTLGCPRPLSGKKNQSKIFPWFVWCLAALIVCCLEDVHSLLYDISCNAICPSAGSVQRLSLWLI